MHNSRAVIYTRISRDREGAGLGVGRQEEDCRTLAAQHGWDVTAVYSDNDISAYSGKPRPGYDALLKAMAARETDVVLVWHTDRLVRRTADLERYIEVSEATGVATHTVKAGSIDLATPAGRAIARTLAAWARYEVEHAIERVRAAKLQAAEAGKWSGGVRPYGYEAGCVALREDEAAIVRELVQRVIGGESFRSCALDLNQRGIKTSTGAAWNALKIRNMLSHARYAGLREHHDKTYPAQWPAVIDGATFQRLQVAIKQHADLYTQRGPARKFLLTGFAHCGRCGNRMNTAPRTSGESRYVCRRYDDVKGEIGCGKVLRMVAPVDLLVAESILFRLDSADFAHQLDLAGQQTPELDDLVAEHHVQQTRLNEIEADYATCRIDARAYARLQTAAQSRLESLGRRIDRLTAQTALSGVPVGERAREAWDAHDLSWRRNVVGLLVEKVTIMPSDTTGMKKSDYWNGYKFRPEDIKIEWKV